MVNDTMASMLSNVALANCSLYGGRRQAHALMVGSLVVMKCCTPCLVGSWVKFGVVMSVNSESNLSKPFVEIEMALGLGARALSLPRHTEWQVFAFTMCLLLRSTRREFARRKSVPSNRLGTSATD